MTQFIRNRALELGFDAIGFAQATYLEDDDRRLIWLEDGRNGTMSWMENNHENALIHVTCSWHAKRTYWLVTIEKMNHPT